MPFQFSKNNSLSALGISSINTNLFYSLTTGGELFYSTDRGATWDSSHGFDGGGGHYFYGASIVPSTVDANTVYLAGSGYSNPGVFVSYDHGQTYSSMSEGLPKTMVYRLAVSDNDKYIFAATQAGPYVYIKSESKWFDMSGLNTPDQTFWSVEFIPSISTARFCTYGRGIWDFKIDGILDVQNENQISDNKFDFTISPNPFIDEAKINFTLSETSNVSLIITDILGRKLYEYTNQIFQIGDHTIYINSKDLYLCNNSNTYIVKLTVNGKAFAHKMIYNK